MTRTLFLHAGPPKTGSTAIQRFFRDNAAIFRRQGLLRPVTGTAHRSHYHFDLVEAFQPHRGQHPLRTKLAAEIEAEGRPDRVFLSAEHFAAKLADAAYLDSLAGFCLGLGYRLHVVAYVRPPAPLLNSLYTQSVKSWRQVPDIDAFVRHEIGTGRHDYMRLFAKLRNRPDADLTLRPFSRSLLAEGITADLCNVMGLSASEGKLTADEEEANVSPGPMTVAAFERLRRRISRDMPSLQREQLSPLTWPLVRAAGAQGWNDTKYGGISVETERLIAEAFHDANRDLARLHWKCAWDDAFTAAEQAAPRHNVFVPQTAPPQQRRQFRAFIEDAMEMAAGLASLHDPQRRQPQEGEEADDIGDRRHEGA